MVQLLDVHVIVSASTTAKTMAAVMMVALTSLMFMMLERERAWSMFRAWVGERQNDQRDSSA